MQQLLILIHVVICVGLVGLILVQQGRGAEMGASFGSGASQTVFGSQGSASFLVKLTAWAALLFFVSTIILGYVTAHQAKQQRGMDSLIPEQGKIAIPAIPTGTDSTNPVQLPSDPVQ